MPYLCSTPATVTPISVADVLAHCRIDAHDDDVYIAGLIAKAVRVLERLMDRQFCTATWKLYLPDFPAEILLTKLPVATVTSITYVNMAGTVTTLTAVTDYQTSILCPDAPGRIAPAYGKTWPSCRGDTYDQVVVTFTCGYGVASAVPVTIKHALLLLVANWYENREASNPDAQNVTASMLPFGVDCLVSLEDWGQYT